MLVRKLLTSLFIIHLLLVPVLYTGCEEQTGFASDNLREVTMASRVENALPLDNTNIFTTDTLVIYCSFQLVKTSPDTDVTAEWFYMDRESDTEFFIDSWTETATGPIYLSMYILQPTQGWPIGDYKVILYVDGKKEVTVPFKVE